MKRIALLIICVLVSTAAEAATNTSSKELAIHHLDWMEGHWTCNMETSLTARKTKGKIVKSSEKAKYDVKFDKKLNKFVGAWKPEHGSDHSSSLYYGYDNAMNKFTYVTVSHNQNAFDDTYVAKAHGNLTEKGLLLTGRGYYQNYDSEYFKEFTLLDANHYHVVIRTVNKAIQYKSETIGDCKK